MFVWGLLRGFRLDTQLWFSYTCPIIKPIGEGNFMYYFDILKELFDRKIDYLIVGGLAVNLYGVPRVTQDIDIIIAFDKENIFKLNEVFKSLGYVPCLA